MEKQVDEWIEDLYGKVGTPSRDAFEHEMAIDILLFDTDFCLN